MRDRMVARTRPTVSQSALMNRQNLEKKEVRLGMAQIVGVLGLSIGSIIAAFCLGFYSGRSMTFERELSNALASLPKLPIENEETAGDIGEKIVSEVYAKLNEQTEVPQKEQELGGEGAPFPELGTIKEAETPPDDQIDAITDDDEESEKDLAAVFEENAAGKQEIVDSPGKKAETLAEVRKGAASEDVRANSESKEILQTGKPETKPTPVVVKPTPTAKPEPTATRKPEPTKQPEKAASKSSVVKPGWYAQIAAPKLISDATEIAAQLRSAGFPAVIETAEVRGEKYFRVLVGPEGTKAQANVLIKQLKREPYIEGDPFLKVVK